MKTYILYIYTYTPTYTQLAVRLMSNIRSGTSQQTIFNTATGKGPMEPTVYLYRYGRCSCIDSEYNSNNVLYTHYLKQVIIMAIYLVRGCLLNNACSITFVVTSGELPCSICSIIALIFFSFTI